MRLEAQGLWGVLVHMLELQHKSQTPFAHGDAKKSKLHIRPIPLNPSSPKTLIDPLCFSVSLNP